MTDIRMRGFKHRTEVHRLRELIEEHVHPGEAEKLPLAECAGRTLAGDIRATVSVPAFDRSAMDGYALRSEETFGAGPYNPLSFAVIGEITPGREFPGVVAPGQAVRIMTGAPLPKGADAVLMAEATTEEAGRMTATEAVAPGKNVGKVGEDVRPGTLLFRQGRKLRPQDLGVLASIGCDSLPIRRKPRITLLITGNELLKPGAMPRDAMIVDSNSIMLKALMERDGAEVAALHHIADDRNAIRSALVSAKTDITVTTGGTSVGVEDHAPILMAEEGQLLVHGIAMRPAAPTGFGLLNGGPVFLLPGNPVSCISAYDLFVGLAIRRRLGGAEGLPYPCHSVVLQDRISSAIGRLDYCRVKLENGKARVLATSGASMLSTTTEADGFVIVPQDSEGVAAGETVEMWCYDIIPQ